MSVREPQSDAAEANVFGKYRLIASLGHGGMADVFLAVAQGPVGFNKLQVIKRLRPNLAEEPEFLAMFLDEARLAARLNHPHIVQTNEVGEVVGQYFIAMEYLDGQPLHRILHRGAKAGALSQPMILKILADTLAGLHAAHELNDYDGTPLRVVHRDATPHNIFVTYEGTTKVVDFGIAKAAVRSADTRTGVLKGKIGYMAPEQARCEAVDRRADLFSIGVILWEVLTGARMWKGMSDVEILDQLMHNRVPDAMTARPDLPPLHLQICRRALAPNRDDRYATAAEMRRDLLEAVAASGVRVADEDVGQVVSNLFQDKRSQLKSILEKQLSGIRTGQIEGVRIMDLPSQSLSLPRITSASMPAEPTPSTSIRAVAPAPTGAVEVPAEMRRSSKVPIVIGAAALAAVLAAAVVVGSNRSSSDAAAAPSQSPTSVATTTTPKPAAQPTIDVKIQVTPADAVVFLDEAKLATPYTSKASADGFGHKLRVEAPGHTPVTQMLVFDKDIDLKVELEPEKKEASGSNAGTSPGTHGGTDLRPNGPGKPIKKKLDNSDPWK